jgi:hypothetical protein
LATEEIELATEAAAGVMLGVPVVIGVEVVIPVVIGVEVVIPVVIGVEVVIPVVIGVSTFVGISVVSPSYKLKNLSTITKIKTPIIANPILIFLGVVHFLKFSNISYRIS